MSKPLHRLKEVARDWRRDRRGATAAEFAMVAAPFIFMIFAIIQVAIFFMVQVTLDNATAMAARELRTGHDASGNPVIADGSGDTVGKQNFMNAICNDMSWLQSQCAANLSINVQTLSNFSTGPSAQTCFYSGNAGSAVELRAYYNWQSIAQVFGQGLQPGVNQLQSTEVFQIEPNGETNPDTNSNPC